MLGGAKSTQAWSTFHGDVSLTGLASIDLASGMAERWRFRIGEPLAGTPVGGGGSIYAVTEDGDLYSIDTAGKQRWSALPCGAAAEGELPERFSASPLVAGSTVVVGSRGGELCAVRGSDGAKLWQHDIGAVIAASPNLLEAAEGRPDSVVVVAQTDGSVHRLDLATGRPLGTSAATNRCDGGVSVRGGHIAYGNCDAALYLLAGDGLTITSKTELLTDGQVFAGVAMGQDAVYAGDRAGRVYAARVPGGQLLWVNQEAQGEVGATPAISADRLVHTTSAGTVACLDRRTGQTLWRTQLGGRPSEPVVTTGGQVVVATDGALHLLNLADGSALWSRELSDAISAPAVIDSLVVVGTVDGFVVAFGATQASGGSP